MLDKSRKGFRSQRELLRFMMLQHLDLIRRRRMDLSFVSRRGFLGKSVGALGSVALLSGLTRRAQAGHCGGGGGCGGGCGEASSVSSSDCGGGCGGHGGGCGEPVGCGGEPVGCGAPAYQPAPTCCAPQPSCGCGGGASYPVESSAPAPAAPAEPAPAPAPPEAAYYYRYRSVPRRMRFASLSKLER